jgi:hypothetical protein
LNQEQLRRLARLGAMARLQQLQTEEAAIRAEFPELFGSGRRRQAAAGAETQDDATGARGGRKGGRKRRRRTQPAMSAEQRKAVSIRMRRYWAERRKAKAAK